MTRVLSTRELNRALLARQLLLKRSPLSVPKALEQIAGIQNQYAPSAYVRLWSSLRKFAMGDLDRLLTQRKVVQGTLMRSTIHLVSARDWWRFAEGIGPSRQDWWQQVWGKEFPRQDMDTVAAKLTRELAGRPWLRKELDALLRAHGSRRGPAGPRAQNPDPARGVSVVGVQHQDASLGGHLPGRWLCCRELADRPVRGTGEPALHALRTADSRS